MKSVFKILAGGSIAVQGKKARHVLESSIIKRFELLRESVFGKKC